MYERTLPEILELKQVVDIREAQQTARNIDEKMKEELDKQLQ